MGFPLAGPLLERIGEGGHSLLKARCPALPLSQGRKGVAEVALRRGPVVGFPLAGPLLERIGEGGHSLLKARCPALPLSQGRKGVAEVALRRGPGVRRTLAGPLLERLGVSGHGLLKAFRPALPHAHRAFLRTQIVLSRDTRARMRCVWSSRRSGSCRRGPEFLTQPLAATGVAPVDQPRQKLFVCVPALEVPASALASVPGRPPS